MNQPPTDSVLRRHYEQLRASRAAAPAPQSAAPKPASPASAPRPAPAPAFENKAKGVRGWLGRLFGG
jgi:hypothetical protein